MTTAATASPSSMKGASSPSAEYGLDAAGPTHEAAASTLRKGMTLSRRRTPGQVGAVVGFASSPSPSTSVLRFMFHAPVTRANVNHRSAKVLTKDHENLSNNDKVKINRKKGMSDICVAQSLLRDAFPSRRYGKVEAAFYEAHKFISRRVRKDFTMRRVRSIWEGTARRIDSEEMDALREAVKEEARREQLELRTRLASLDEKIAAFDAATSRQAVAPDRGGADRMG